MFSRKYNSKLHRPAKKELVMFGTISATILVSSLLVATTSNATMINQSHNRSSVTSQQKACDKKYEKRHSKKAEREYVKCLSGDAIQGAGMDVSPALNGCIGFSSLDGDSDHVNWKFVDKANVPAGPWLNVQTTSQVNN